MRKRDKFWKVTKSLFALLVIGGLCWFVWIKLQGNQAQKLEMARLASQINDVFPVEVVEVAEEPFEEGTTVFGKLIPGKMAYLLADAIGKVTVLYKRKGDFVRKGEVVANPDRIAWGNDQEADNQQAQQTLRVAVTRAKQKTTILTPETDPCVLLR